MGDLASSTVFKLLGFYIYQLKLPICTKHLIARYYNTGSYNRYAVNISFRV